VDDVSQGQAEVRVECYEPPTVVKVGQLTKVTKGQYSIGQSDDSDAGGYWSP
jgi:hypothetical protein